MRHDDGRPARDAADRDRGHRRDLRGSGERAGAGGATRSAAGDGRTPGRGRAASGSADPDGGQDVRLQPTVRRDRQGHREQLALVAHLLAEGAAARAVAQVQPQLGASQRAAAQVGQLLADLLAGQLARLAAGHEPGARAVDKRLHARHLAAEDRGDVGLRQAADLGQQQRRALLVGQLAQVGQQLAQLGALLDLLGQP